METAAGVEQRVAKKRKIDINVTGDQALILQNDEVSEKRSRNRPAVGLLDMPNEILEKIIGYVSVWCHFNIRMTSKRLRDVDDSYIEHEFRKSLLKDVRENPASLRSASLKCLLRATEAYSKSGYLSTFCGCLMPFLRHNYKKTNLLNPYEVTTFLLHFYNLMDNVFDDPDSYQARLLYNITLIRLLKDFMKCKIIIISDMAQEFCASVEIFGPWLGILWITKAKNMDHYMRRKNLLLIIAELYIANTTDEAFKRVWEFKNEVYILGNQTDETKRAPTITFTFHINGPKKMCSLFRSVFQMGIDEFEWPPEWPDEGFNVNLQIACKEATKWGCPKSFSMFFVSTSIPTQCETKIR